MPRRSRHRLRRALRTVAVGYLPVWLSTLVVVLPLLWMVLSSVKTPAELISQTPQLLPAHPSLHNYVTAADRVPFPRLFVNSIIVTTVGAGLKVVLAVCCAYALVFVRFRFSRAVFFLVLATLMVPSQVSLLPNFVLVSSLGGQDTYWGIILPGLGSGFGAFLLRQQFLSVPPSLLEAAELDGAGHWRRLTRIIVPVCAPAIATVTLVSIVYEWNEYLWPLVIVSEPSMMTLPVGLTLLQNSESGAAAYGVLMAGTVLVIVPVLVVFTAFQRYIVAGLAQGAVKE
ncbi:carbohydrate ABC transporter permease [Quadrisphaera oryzae]|uniref:carbohydrate ABC transporter permease n=1 Tax=Quadrisphaera TaxID=317661 RepID=UPI00351BF11A